MPKSHELAHLLSEVINQFCNGGAGRMGKDAY